MGYLCQARATINKHQALLWLLGARDKKTRHNLHTTTYQSPPPHHTILDILHDTPPPWQIVLHQQQQQQQRSFLGLQEENSRRYYASCCFSTSSKIFGLAPQQKKKKKLPTPTPFRCGVKASTPKIVRVCLMSRDTPLLPLTHTHIHPPHPPECGSNERNLVGFYLSTPLCTGRQQQSYSAKMTTNGCCFSLQSSTHSKNEKKKILPKQK